LNFIAGCEIGGSNPSIPAKNKYKMNKWNYTVGGRLMDGTIKGFDIYGKYKTLNAAKQALNDIRGGDRFEFYIFPYYKHGRYYEIGKMWYSEQGGRQVDFVTFYNDRQGSLTESRKRKITSFVDTGSTTL
jgi:hypothetical protein